MKYKLGIFLIGFILCCTYRSYAQKAIPVSGTLNFVEKKIAVEFGDKEDSSFHLEAVKIADTLYEVQLFVTEWDLSLFTVSTLLKGSLEILTSEEDGVYAVGKLRSDYTLLNNYSFGGISANILINDEEVVIRSFSLKPFSISGKISFLPKQDLDLILKFSDASLVDVFSIFKKDKILDVDGIVDGDLRLSGSPKQLQIRGILNSYDGSVVGYDYNIARLNVLGVYPLINITDSYVAQNDGFSFEVNGILDLSDMKNFTTQIKAFTGSPLISEDGQDREWTLKRMQSQQEGVTTEFKYMLRKDDDRDDALIGIERKIEF